MDITLASWAGIAFLIGFASLFTNIADLINKLDPKKYEIKTEVTANEIKLFLPSFKYFFAAIFFVLDLIVLNILEVALPIIALSKGIGDPAFAITAMGIWLLATIYGIVRDLKQNKIRLQNIKDGVTFVPKKTPLIFKIIAFLPDVYILYLFLIAITVLA